MTPAEYIELAEGWNWREKRREEQEAKWVTILANAGGRLKKKLRIEDVLGRTPMAKQKEVAEIKKRRAAQKKQRALEAAAKEAEEKEK